MTAIADLDFLCGDTETTGVSVHKDRVVTASLVELPATGQPTFHDWVVDPGIPIPDEAAAVHGWTTEKVQSHADARDPGQAIFEISGHIALWVGATRPLVMANASYDASIIEAENHRHGVPTLAERLAPLPVGPVLDPMVLEKHADPYRKVKGGCLCGCGAQDKTLAGLCLHYGVELTDAHSANADALAAGLVTRAILRSHAAKFNGFTLGGLHMAQARWRAEQMTSLRRYFDRKGTAHDGCCPGWPVHGDCCAPTPAVAREQQGVLIP